MSLVIIGDNCKIITTANYDTEFQMIKETCIDCLNFIHKPLALEAEFKGLNILSSALGSVRADTGWCKENDLFVVSTHQCEKIKTDD